MPSFDSPTPDTIAPAQLTHEPTKQLDNFIARLDHNDKWWELEFRRKVSWRERKLHPEFLALPDATYPVEPEPKRFWEEV